MATIEFRGIEVYAKRLAELGPRAEAACKYAAYPAAALVIEAVKANTPVDTGDLRDSEKLSPFRVKNGFIYTQLSFEGKDRKGVANVLKARALESGTSKRKKKPFVRPAVNRVREQAETLMQQGLDDYFAKIMGK
ncbi:MAG: hypothetical protein IJ124_06010 [Clostridia bacterium]|nr:hypothetical protein [Clostridia bacterium]